MSTRSTVWPPQTSPRDDAGEERESTTRRYLTAVAHRGTPGEDRGEAAPAATFVRELMHPGVVAAHEGAQFKEIVDALVRNRISAVPVIDADRRVVGVVTEADLMARLAGGRLVLPAGHLLSAPGERRAKLRATTARELMTTPPVVTTPYTTVQEAAELCARSRVRRLPVVDEQGVLVGIVTRGDLLRVFLRPDRDIRDDVRRGVLDEAQLFNPNAIDVEVHEGTVTLRGRVGTRLVAEAVTRRAYDVSGVVAVDDSALRYDVDDRVLPTWPTVL
jgi:CBS domain-containing protein